ncbi:hypothetical protein PV682_27750 [Streptomyces niveiscabiei]|uniref:hypothetical protein n=1 Tax=Streptomyces niveiscabiei TaxID=164115 RepID=UPI0029ADF5B6|nr:hypothetical protein [Streptomyces niveiscabiei]MDX3385239.1 hypothetical protein [Streptomyces niveiscabiei]
MRRCRSASAAVTGACRGAGLLGAKLRAVVAGLLVDLVGLWLVRPHDEQVAGVRPLGGHRRDWTLTLAGPLLTPVQTTACRGAAKTSPFEVSKPMGARSPESLSSNAW